MFYSISNCQPGLAGVNLGTALIKQVVEALRLDLPQLRRFVTLSPIPGFRSWVESELDADGARLRTGERDLLPAEPARVLARLSAPEWDVDEAIRPALLALCARYLTSTVEGRVADPVANFHLTNGATVERINWMADASPTGRARSFGIMANYLYEPDHIPERRRGLRDARRGAHVVRGARPRRASSAARPALRAAGRGTRRARRRSSRSAGRLLGAEGHARRRHRGTRAG